jgi:hypothetical protein
MGAKEQVIPYNKVGDKPETVEMEQLVKRWLGPWISRILTKMQHLRVYIILFQ